MRGESLRCLNSTTQSFNSAMFALVNSNLSCLGKVNLSIVNAYIKYCHCRMLKVRLYHLFDGKNSNEPLAINVLHLIFSP